MPIHCPTCNTYHTTRLKTYHTRNSIRRKRQCANGHTFITKETIVRRTLPKSIYGFHRLRPGQEQEYLYALHPHPGLLRSRLSTAIHIWNRKHGTNLRLIRTSAGIKILHLDPHQ